MEELDGVARLVVSSSAQQVDCDLLFLTFPLQVYGDQAGTPTSLGELHWSARDA